MDLTSLDSSYKWNRTICGLCVWLLSLNTVFSRFIHVVARVRTSSLLMAKYYPTVWTDHILFIHHPHPFSLELTPTGFCLFYSTKSTLFTVTNDIHAAKPFFSHFLSWLVGTFNSVLHPPWNIFSLWFLGYCSLSVLLLHHRPLPPAQWGVPWALNIKEQTLTPTPGTLQPPYLLYFFSTVLILWHMIDVLISFVCLPPTEGKLHEGRDLDCVALLDSQQLKQGLVPRRCLINMC